MKEYILKQTKETYEPNDHMKDCALTEVYNDLQNDKIKEDFYKNQFNGELSTFFKDNNEVVGGILANSVEPIEGETRYTCSIYGIATINKDEKYLESLLRQFIFRVKHISLKKVPKRFKGKYSEIIATPSNEKQKSILESIGFINSNSNSEEFFYKIR